jgi:hypothetical protein
VAPRTNIPARPLAPVQPTIAQPWELKREAQRKREEIPKRIPRPQPIRRAAEIIPPKSTDTQDFEVQKEPLPIQKASTVVRPAAHPEESRADIAMLLTSTSGLRNAIILREILGQPLGLHTVDLV